MCGIPEYIVTVYKVLEQEWPGNHVQDVRDIEWIRMCGLHLFLWLSGKEERWEEERGGEQRRSKHTLFFCFAKYLR